MPRRTMDGKVVSNSADQTISVLVERKTMHPIYKKYIRRSKKYAAHDAKNECEVGDTVTIQECAPMSKTKTWAMIEIKEKVKKAK